VSEVNESDNSQSATKSSKSSRSKKKCRKRPAEPLSEAESAQIRLKRIRQRLATTPRSELNAISVLYLYSRQLNYEVINVSGAVHDTIYTVRVEVDGLVSIKSTKLKYISLFDNVNLLKEFCIYFICELLNVKNVIFQRVTEQYCGSV